MQRARLGRLAVAVAAAHVLAWRLGSPAEPARSAAPARARPVRWLVLAPPASAPRGSPVDAGPPIAPARDTRPPPRPLPAAGVSTSAAVAHRRAAAPAAPPVVASAPPAGRAWPRYPTRLPPSTSLAYRLAQAGPGGERHGQARLDWSRGEDGYVLELAATLDGRPARTWRSAGALAATGLAPERLAEREATRRGERERRAVAIDRAAGVARYAGAAGERPVGALVQDRWSWLVQLAAIAERRPGAPPGTAWMLQVAGLRGDVEGWTFRVVEADPARGLHVVRAATRPYDLAVDAWLDPARHHLPGTLSLSAPPGTWRFTLEAAPPGPVGEDAPAASDKGASRPATAEGA